jgi:hypothetical protein
MKRFFQFDKYNTAYDWDLVLTAQDLTPPAPKTNYVQLDGRSGSLDLTEALTGEVAYNDRTLTASFTVTAGTYADRVALLRTITAALHGHKVRIVPPDDPEHYLLGRCTVTPVELHQSYMALTITATCDPWRYAVNETERRVEAPGDVVIRNDGVKTLTPVLTVDGSVAITVNGATTELTEGSYKITDLRLTPGVNVIGVSGSGSVTFTYREADL